MKASKFIEKYGWIQYTFGNKEGGFCLLGAISEANPTNEDYKRIRDKLLKLLNIKDLSVWNDQPERTKKEVVDLLESIGE